MMWVIKLVEFFILTVNRQSILCQIVGSDTEEINHLCKSVTDDRCCRGFDHDSLFRNLILNFLRFQFSFHFCNDLVDTFYFFCRSDHRIHDRKISIYSGTKKCTKLCLKNLRLFQTDTDRTVTHCRVVFISEVKIIYLLVSSNIQCTDDHFLSCHHLYSLLVCLELLFLCREIISSEIQEFTSEKSDSAGIVFHYITDIANTSDICVNIDLTAIQSNVFFAFEFLKKFQFFFFFLHSGFSLCFEFFIRLKSHFSPKTIYNSSHSGLKFFEIHLHTNQCRNVHHTCKDCGMRVCRTMNCYKCKDLVLIHLYSLTRA